MVDAASLDQDRPARPVVLDGVADQTVHHLVEGASLGLDGQTGLERRRAQVDPRRPSLVGQGLADAARDQQRVQTLGGRRTRRGGAGEDGQALDQGPQPDRRLANLIDGLGLAMAEGVVDGIDPQQVGETEHGVQGTAHLATGGAQQGGVGASAGGLDRLGPQQARLDVAHRALQIDDAASGDGGLTVMQPLRRAYAPMGADRQPDAGDPRRQTEGDRQ
ncbi:hypothetical protein D3C73_981240 [compost metagenome]